jgi:hypothetical protein
MVDLHYGLATNMLLLGELMSLPGKHSNGSILQTVAQYCNAITLTLAILYEASEDVLLVRHCLAGNMLICKTKVAQFCMCMLQESSS